MRKSNLSAARLLVCVENNGYRGHRKGVTQKRGRESFRATESASIASIESIASIAFLTEGVTDAGRERLRREAGRDQVTGTSVKPS